MPTMNALQNPNGWQKRVLTVACFFVTAVLFLLATIHLLSMDTDLLLKSKPPERFCLKVDRLTNYNRKPYPEPILEQQAAFMRTLKQWRARAHRLDNDTVAINDKYSYKIARGNHRWPKLGNRTLIVDIDTRYDNVEGGLMSKMTLTRSNIIGRSAGYLNHYFFALIHGYDYRYIRAPKYDDRHSTWVKVPVVKQALENYDFVVFLDSDAIIQRLDVPIEWLMSHWGVNNRTLAAMAEDPNSPVNQDANGWVLWNTGFIIAQSSDRTKRMFEKWENCPLGQDWPGCKRWAWDWAHEQAAFGAFVRYGYDLGDSLKVISCMEGNGAPYIGDKKCGGHFIAHHWSNKAAPINDLFSNLDERMVGALHHHFIEHMGTNYIDWSQHKYPLGEVQVE